MCLAKLSNELGDQYLSEESVSKIHVPGQQSDTLAKVRFIAILTQWIRTTTQPQLVADDFVALERRISSTYV